MMNVPLRSPRRSRASWAPVVVLLGAIVAALGVAVSQDPTTSVIAAAVIVAPFLLYFLVTRPLFALAVTNSVHAYSIDLGGGFVSPYKISFALAILTTAYHVRKRGSLLPLPRGFSVAMLVILGEVFAEYESSPMVLVEFGSSLLTFLMASQLIEKTSDGWVLAKVNVLNLLLVTVTVLRDGSWSMLEGNMSRASGIIGQPNALGIFAANILPFAFALLVTRTTQTRWRVVGFIGILASVYCQWGAASRGGASAAVAATVIFAWMAGRTLSRRVLAIGTAVLAINLAVMVAPASFTRVTDTFSAGAQGGTIDTSERADHVALGAEMFPHHPWLGHGFSAFGYERSRTTGSLGQSLHSAIFAVLVSYGVFAGILFVLMPVAGMFRVLSRRDTSPDRLVGVAAAAAVGGAFIASISGSNIFGSENWSNIAICYILALRIDETNDASARRARQPAATP